MKKGRRSVEGRGGEKVGRWSSSGWSLVGVDGELICNPFTLVW